MDLAPDKEQSGVVPAGDAPQPAAAPAIAPPAAQHHPVPIWLERVMLFIRVAFAVWIGLFLLGIPWWDAGRAWTENAFLLAHPALRSFLALDFVRGIVSGLGLVDIWIGVWWAVHYKELHLH